MTRWVLAMMASLALPATGAQNPPQTEITIYNTAGAAAPLSARDLRVLAHEASALPGFAWVREPVQLDLPAGDSEVRYAHIPALLDPATVQLRPSRRGELTVLGQRFLPDAGNTRQILQQFVGQRVEVEQARGDKLVRMTGLLLSAEEGLVLRDDAGELHLLRSFDHVRLPASSADLTGQPALVWTLSAAKAQKASFDLAYETAGVTWWADYRLAYETDAKGCRARLSAWATVVNRTGRSYTDARLQLVAGQPHRVNDAPMLRGGTAAMMEAAPAPADFSRERLGEYHLYTLQRPITLVDGAVQQVPLLPEAPKAKCTQSYQFGDPDAGRGHALRAPMIDPGYRPEPRPAVRALLAFDNSTANGLGVALPAGRVRMTVDGPDGAARFVGEDRIRHTTTGETVQLALGEAFDLVGERSQQDFAVDQDRRIMEETLEIRLRNQKKHAVVVQVHEHLARWRQWQVLETNHEFEKLDADSIRFAVPVPAGGEARLRYRVRYSW